MLKALRTAIGAALCLSFLTLLPSTIPAASAAACTTVTGTVSGNSRYVIFNSGSACTWSVPSGVTSISYFAVGGGGGGGGGNSVGGSWYGGGGGGAGGQAASGTLTSTPGGTVTISVGTGGAGGAVTLNGTDGTATTIAHSSTNISASGGTGGGGATGTYAQASMSGDGGSNSSYTGGLSDWDGGGGGAGAGAAGGAGVDIGGQGGSGGNGGTGTSTTLLGSTQWFGGGGGGGGTPSSSSNTDGGGGTGGSSVGGTGGGGTTGQATAATANTGSGGGGGAWRSDYTNAQRAGAAGADGKIIFVFTKAAATINSISITSNAGADNAYSLNNVISVTVVASEAITVTGTPRIPVLGLTSKYFNYASGTGTTSLVFTYTVVTGDSATAGIGVTLNTLALNSGTMQDTGDLPLVLTHAGIAQSSSHQVDGILPAFSGVTQTFSVPENETRTINLTTTEPATLTKSGGGDSAYFILNTAVSPATLTITARDFENKLDADSNNVYYVGITLRDAANNNTGSYNFFVTITDVAEYANVSAPTLSAQPVKGIVVTITVTSDVAGKVDFYANRKRIAGCLARLTSGSSAPFTATCTWKTTSVAPATLYATMNPTNSAYAVTTSPSVIVASSARKTTR